MNDLYRGFEISRSADGSFAIITDGRVHSDGYPTDEAAMNAIDAYKRASRAA